MLKSVLVQAFSILSLVGCSEGRHDGSSIASSEALASHPDTFSKIFADEVVRAGKFRVLEAHYSLEPTTEDGIVEAPTEGASARTTQLAGQLYLPDTAGPRPLVVLLHGNHATCGFYPDNSDERVDPRLDITAEYTTTGECPDGFVAVPSYRGYDYVARHLASHGLAVVSIDANRGITSARSPGNTDPSLIAARGRLVLRTLELLVDWNRGEEMRSAPRDFPLRGRFDFSQVGMMGHSRGGEGVRAAYTIYHENRPLSFTWRNERAEIGFRALFEIGAVDFGYYDDDEKDKTYFDARGVAWNALIAGCDGDVSNHQGINPFTRMLGEPAGLPRSVIVAWGANHNFFNTEWQTSDTSEECRGSQTPLWNSLAPRRPVVTSLPMPTWWDSWSGYYAGMNLAGVKGSEKQQAIGRMLMTAFFKAHLGSARIPALAEVFDPGTRLPSELSSLTSFSRESDSPESGSSLGSDEILSSLSKGRSVEVQSFSDFLDEEARLVEKMLLLKAKDPGESYIWGPRTVDALVLSWNTLAHGANPSSAHPTVTLPLPQLPAMELPGTVRIVLADVQQTRPCLVPVLDGSCRGISDELDFSIQLVNADGAASVKRRASDFLTLKRHLKSSVLSAFEEPADPENGTPGYFGVDLGEPLFDTLVLRPSQFTTFDGKAFPFSSRTQVRFVFEHTPAGALAIRSIRAIGEQK